MTRIRKTLQNSQSRTRKIRIRPALMVLALALMLTACQPTPDSGLVKSKNEDTFMDNLATPGPTFTQEASVPDSTPMPAQHRFTDYTPDWSQTLEVKPYPITVHIDAHVVTPIADTLPVYEVIPQRITQEQVDGFLSQFGEVTYHLNMDLKTKSDYEAMILEAQESIAQYNQRKDRTPEQKEEHKKSLEEGIEYFKQWMRDAPDTVDDVIDPVFTSRYIGAQSDEPEILIDENGEALKPSEDSETALEHFERTNTQSINIKWETDDIQSRMTVHRSDNLVNNSFRFITENMGTGNRPNDIESLLQMSAMSVNTVANTGSLDGLATTYEQARAMASDALSLLGIDYMALAYSAKNIKYGNLKDLNYTDTSFYTDFDSLEYTDQAYVFYYTRSIAGVGETHCSNFVMYRDQYDEPWPYERLTVIVDDTGVKEITWDSCSSELHELISEDCELLLFDEVMTIAAQQIGIGNLDFQGTVFHESTIECLVNMDLRVDSIELGYARVKLSDGSGRYVLVPVWDFFGSFTGTQNMDKNPRNFYSREHDSVLSYRHSFLTINAIDGSVIDRGAGY